MEVGVSGRRRGMAEIVLRGVGGGLGDSLHVTRGNVRSTVENCPSFVVDSFLSRRPLARSSERRMAERKKAYSIRCTKRRFSLKGFAVWLGDF